MNMFEEKLLNMRPCLESDKDFVYQTKKITMKKSVVKIWGVWDEVFQKDRFDKNFDSNITQIVQYLKTDIGIFVVEEFSDRFQVDNIQLLPEYQNKGIGSFLLISLIKKAKKIGKSVTLQVLKSNPEALKLYERLGFKNIKETEFHFQMKRN